MIVSLSKQYIEFMLNLYDFYLFDIFELDSVNGGWGRLVGGQDGVGSVCSNSSI
ncbi:hypothetical protein D3C80_1932130 [compost metagenome]